MMTLIKLLKDFWTIIRWRCFLFLFLSTLLGMIRGVSLLMILPFLPILGIGDTSETLPPFIQSILDIFTQMGIPLTLESVILFYILVIFSFTILRYLESQNQLAILRDYNIHLQSREFDWVLNKRWSELSKISQGNLLNKQMRDIGMVSQAIQSVLMLVSCGFVLITLVVPAFLIFWQGTLVSLAIGIICFLMLQPIQRKIYKAGQKARQKSEDVYQGITEYYSALKLIKSWGREQHASHDFHGRIHDLANTQYKSGLLQVYTPLTYTIVGASAISFLLYFAIKLLHINGSSLLVLILIITRLLPCISQIHTHLQRLANALPSIQAILKKTDLKKECITNESNPTERIELGRELSIKNLDFGYSGKPPVISNLNATIPARKITVLSGSSGIGKTTFCDLILGLLEASNGGICADDQALHSTNIRAWKASVAYMTQDSFLFSNTIRNNFLWLCPEAGEEQIWKVLKMASAADFVRKLPNGMDTHVGEQGIELSGGERQRIALARALLMNPTLLVLDEPTSALDIQAEEQIIDVLKRLKIHVTILVVTHRERFKLIADHQINLES